MYVPPEKKCRFQKIEDEIIFCSLSDMEHSVSLKDCERCKIGVIYRECDCKYIRGKVSIEDKSYNSGFVLFVDPLCSSKDRGVTIEYCKSNCEEC